MAKKTKLNKDELVDLPKVEDELSTDPYTFTKKVAEFRYDASNLANDKKEFKRVFNKYRDKILLNETSEQVKIKKFEGFAVDIKEYAVDPDKLSFKINQDELEKIIEQLINFIRDPIAVTQQLQDLDKELGAELTKANIDLQKNPKSDVLLASFGHFVPGPPPENYVPQQKKNILNNLLLEHEQANGINKNGVYKFVGIIPADEADSFVAKGQIFSENEQASDIAEHGKNTHRIAFEAIRSAVKNKVISLTAGGKPLTEKQLLELFIHVRHSSDKTDPKKKGSLWNAIIDNVSDQRFSRDNDLTPQNDPRNPAHYSYSCRTPQVFNNLLLCFGEDLGLPNLQAYLRDTHYKEMFKHINRVFNEIPSLEKKYHKDPKALNQLYLLCANIFAYSRKKFGQFKKYFFTEDENLIKSKDKYLNSSTDTAGIIKQTASDLLRPQSSNWSNFFRIQNDLPPEKEKKSFFNFKKSK